MAPQQIPFSSPGCLLLRKPREAGMWLTGNVVLVAPILLLVHYHPSAETTSCLSHVFTIPVLSGHSIPCVVWELGDLHGQLSRMPWESLPLPRPTSLLFYQNGV